VTDCIIDWIEKTSKIPINDGSEESKGEEADICLVEIGGTVGDLESGVYFEAIR